MVNKTVLQSAQGGSTVLTPWASKETAAAAWARVAELEAELAEVGRRFQRKEEESKQPAPEAKLQEVSRATAGALKLYEEKVGNLSLDLSAAQNRAKLAELARDEAARQARAEWQDTAQQLRDRLAEEESCRKLAEDTAQRLRERLAKEESCREAAEERARSLEKENAKLRIFHGLEKERAVAPSSLGGEDAGHIVRDLQLQVAEEMQRRMRAESKLLDKDEQLQEAEHRLAATPRRATTGGGEAPKRSVAEQSRQLEMEGQLQHLQQQVANEVEKRIKLTEQLEDYERQVAESWAAKEGDDLEQQKTVQCRVINKEREVCELQRQLADELYQRRMVQNQLLEKDCLIRKLQRRMTRTSSKEGSGSPSPPPSPAKSTRSITIPDPPALSLPIAARGAQSPPVPGRSAQSPPASPTKSAQSPPASPAESAQSPPASPAKGVRGPPASPAKSAAGKSPALTPRQLPSTELLHALQTPMGAHVSQQHRMPNSEVLQTTMKVAVSGGGSAAVTNHVYVQRGPVVASPVIGFRRVASKGSIAQGVGQHSCYAPAAPAEVGSPARSGRASLLKEKTSPW